MLCRRNSVGGLCVGGLRDEDSAELLVTMAGLGAVFLSGLNGCQSGLRPYTWDTKNR